MDDIEQTNVRLAVENEIILYTPFSPDPELSDYVKGYIKSKMAGKDYRRSVKLTVISKVPLDEEKFRTAVVNWTKDEKAEFRITEKTTRRTLLGLLLFGSVMIMLSMYAVKQFDMLQYTLLPILGSLSLGRAVHIMILDMPTVKAERWLINEMEKNSVISFEYDIEKDEE